MNEDLGLRLYAQRALLGHITPNLRAVSCELSGGNLKVRSYYAVEPDEDEREEVAMAATEMLANYLTEMLEGDFIVSTDPIADLKHLRLLVYERYEPR